MLECRLVPDKEDDNWCTIRFHAGAPYEDVAFRVGIRECGHVDCESGVGPRTQVRVPKRVREGYFALVL